jgi:hypothetical protein
MPGLARFAGSRSFAPEQDALFEMLVYAVDLTLIDRSRALYTWNNWTGSDATVESHTALHRRVPRPLFLHVAPAYNGDVVWKDDLPIERDSFQITDRGYVDLWKLRPVHQAGAFVVIRVRLNVRH